MRQPRVYHAFANRDLAAKTAAFAAASAVGTTFAPSLLKRGPLDQAIVTGLSASLSYGIASISQSFIDNLSRRVAPGRERPRNESRKYLNAIANSTAIVGGLALQKTFPPRHGEPVKRAGVRTLGWEMTQTGAAGLGLTAVLGAAEAWERRTDSKWHPARLPWGFIGGAVISAGEIVWYRRHEQDSPPLINSLAQGMLVMAGVTAVGVAETKVAEGIANFVRKGVPGLSLLAEPIGHTIGLGLLAGGVSFGMEFVYQKAEQGGAAVEAAYAEAPIAEGSSGGPKSLVQFDSLSREGRRFVNMTLEPAEITAVTGWPALPPIRAFVGLSSAPTVDSRVALLMQELETLGAFERSLIVLCSPTGTGYLNYVLAESVEYMTAGDCATVGLQYSLRPSFLSLDKVKIGREQNRALMHAINGRLMGIPPERRPRLVAFGESLGAHTFQDAFIHEGTGGLRRAGVQRGLFIGTPAESKWAEQWRLDPQRYDPGQEIVEVADYDEWQALPEDRRERCRFILLSHHEDPICKFSPALAVQAPPWMSKGDTRSPALPKGVTWTPFTTFLLTAVDMKNATNVIPGTFESLGHDYRAGIARFTSLAYNLPISEEQLSMIEAALRQRELVWAERRLVAEQFAQARESVAAQLHSWGASPDAVPQAFQGLAAMSAGVGGISSSSGQMPTTK